MQTQGAFTMRKIVSVFASPLLLAGLLLAVTACAISPVRQHAASKSASGSLVPPLMASDYEGLQRLLSNMRHAPDPEEQRAARYFAHRLDPENLEVLQSEIDDLLHKERRSDDLFHKKRMLNEAVSTYAQAYLIAQRTGQTIRPPDPRLLAAAREDIETKLPDFIDRFRRALPSTDPEHVKAIIVAYNRCEEPQRTARTARRHQMVRWRVVQGVKVEDGVNERGLAILEAEETRQTEKCIASSGLPGSARPDAALMGGPLVVEQAATALLTPAAVSQYPTK